MMFKHGIFNGADALVKALDDLGVRCVFGLPGSQNVALFESLRPSGIRTVLATSETAAGFMANGWSRASGQPGVFIGIAGPGFAWAVPPLAEAALDSAAILFITGKPPDRGYKHDLQSIEQSEIAAALNCEVFNIDDLEFLSGTVRDAWSATMEQGPRPVVLQISSNILEQEWPSDGVNVLTAASARSNAAALPDEFIAHLRRATRPVILAGAGTLEYAKELERLLDATGAAFFTTPSARGVIRESHPMCLRTDLLTDSVDVVNDFLKSADIVLALGCRFSHNGTKGFGLKMAADKLIHVDIDSGVLEANYPARWPVCADVGQFLNLVLQELGSEGSEAKSEWRHSEVDECRERLRSTRMSVRSEPVWMAHGNCRALFDQIREGLPDDGVIVTDTGLHQILARTHLDVLSPRGLIFPTDFQSMGFGLPAAIGAALSTPDRAVVGLIGDGSLLMVGAELSTAKREGLSLPVLVFCDGYLGQIRMEQLVNFGYESGTQLQPIDLAAYSRSLGAEHVLGGANLAAQIRSALEFNGPTIIEVRIDDSDSLGEIRAQSRRKNLLKSAMGPSALRLLRRLRG